MKKERKYMEPEFLLGDQQILKCMNMECADVPFCEDAVEFLDKVSKLLMKKPEAKAFPDLITFAFWCRKSAVMEMKKQVAWLPASEKKGVFGRGIAFHIAPSNVAMNFAYSFAAALLAGNMNIVRLPSRQFPQIDCLCGVLKEVMDQMTVYQRRICFVRYGHEKEITDMLSAMSDVRIIWGGDKTIQEIQKSPLKIRGKDIVFADRYSLAVIDTEEYLALTEDEKRKKAKDFYNDTYLMDQNACTAPSLIVWRGKKDSVQLAQKQFWCNNFEVIEEKYELQAVQAVKKLQAAYRLAVAMPESILVDHCICNGRAKQVDVDNRMMRVCVSGLSKELMSYRENSGFFMEYATEELQDILPVCTQRCQTISYLGECLGTELRTMIKRYRSSGVDRIVPMGKTMDFSLIWDGYDLIREMSREIA